MNNVSHIPREEQLLSRPTDGSGTKMLLKSERKSVEWMIDLVSRFFKGAEMVLDTCPGTLATANVCLQLPEHCEFVGLEKHTASFGMHFRRWCTHTRIKF